MPKEEKANKTIVVSVETDQRLLALGDMGDTREIVLRKLLSEAWFLPQLKTTLVKLENNVEDAKKVGHLNPAAADDLCRLLRTFIEKVKTR